MVLVNRISTVSSWKRCHFLRLLTLHSQLSVPDTISQVPNRIRSSKVDPAKNPLLAVVLIVAVSPYFPPSPKGTLSYRLTYCDRALVCGLLSRRFSLIRPILSRSPFLGMLYIFVSLFAFRAWLTIRSFQSFGLSMSRPKLLTVALVTLCNAHSRKCYCVC